MNLEVIKHVMKNKQRTTGQYNVITITKDGNSFITSTGIYQKDTVNNFIKKLIKTNNITDKYHMFSNFNVFDVINIDLVKDIILDFTIIEEKPI